MEDRLPFVSPQVWLLTPIPVDCYKHLICLCLYVCMCVCISPTSDSAIICLAGYRISQALCRLHHNG